VRNRVAPIRLQKIKIIKIKRIPEKKIILLRDNCNQSRIKSSNNVKSNDVFTLFTNHYKKTYLKNVINAC
jgi:ribosomal 50S subunit-recycling heat shock protein